MADADIARNTTPPFTADLVTIRRVRNGLVIEAAGAGGDAEPTWIADSGEEAGTIAGELLDGIEPQGRGASAVSVARSADMDPWFFIVFNRPGTCESWSAIAQGYTSLEMYIGYAARQSELQAAAVDAATARVIEAARALPGPRQTASTTVPELLWPLGRASVRVTLITDDPVIPF